MIICTAIGEGSFIEMSPHACKVLLGAVSLERSGNQELTDRAWQCDDRAWQCVRAVTMRGSASFNRTPVVKWLARPLVTRPAGVRSPDQVHY